MLNRKWKRTISAIRCIIVIKKGGGKMRNFFAALSHRVGASSSFGTYLVALQRRCARTKRPSDCDGIPSMDEARKDYQAATRTRNVFRLP